ncbi:MAG: TonB-dependent receptor plug domain-containing protein, partial [Bacteroidota bacterium]
LLDIKMTISSTPLPEIEVKDKRRDNLTMVPIDPKTISVLPNTTGSFEAVLKTFAGVVSNNELSSQYSVRGGNFDENLVYVNDIEVFRPILVRSGQQEGLSFINPDMVSAVSFSAGGFDAVYGDKLSSVLDVKYKTPNKFGGSAYASLLGGGLHLEGVNKSKNIKFLFGARQKSSKYLFNSLETKGEYKPSFSDVQGLFTWSLNQKNDLTVLGNYSSNKYQIVPANRQTEFGTINQALRLTMYFEGQEVDQYSSGTGALSFTHRYSDSSWVTAIGSYYKSIESENFDILGQYYIDELEKDLGSDNFGEAAFNLGVGSFLEHARNSLDASIYNFDLKAYKERKRGTWQFGLQTRLENISDKLSEWEYIDSAGFAIPHPPDNIGQAADPNQLIEFQEVIKTDTTLNNTRYAAYVMHSFNFGSNDQYALNTGLRASYRSLSEELLWSPRLSLSYKPDWEKNFLFKLATGVYYQPPFYREMRDFDGKLNTDLKSQRSIHFVAGMEHTFLAWGRELKFVSEIYYKKLDDMVPYKVENLRLRYFANNNSSGYATGADFRINGEFVPGIESWASLSLLKTMEDISDDYYYTFYNSDGQEIIPGFTFNDTPVDSVKTEPGKIARPTDQRVTFSVFFQDYLPKNPSYRMSMTLVYGTGLPFGPPGANRYKDVLRFPSYRRIDIGFSKTIIEEDEVKNFRFKLANKLKYFSIGLEVFNLLQVNNTVSYLWVTDVTDRTYAVPNYLSARTLNIRLNARF